jgi:hypothetical protein
MTNVFTLSTSVWSYNNKSILKNYYAPYRKKKHKTMPVSNSLLLINKDFKYFFNPFAYKFNLNELQPSIGEPFSYFTQSSWTICSSTVFNHIGSKSSDIPVPCSSKEITPNERTITIEW